MSLGFPKDLDTSFIKTGAVLCDPKYPIHMAKKFRARVVVYDVAVPLIKGQEVTVHAFSNRVPGVLYSIDMTIN